MLSLSPCIVCGFDSCTVLFKYPQRNFDDFDFDFDGCNRVEVAAIKITMLHRVYLNMTRRAQLCIDAGANHFQNLV